MKIQALIQELNRVYTKEGDIEVVVVQGTLSQNGAFPDVYETTCENLEVKEHKTIGKCVRLWL